MYKQLLSPFLIGGKEDMFKKKQVELVWSLDIWNYLSCDVRVKGSAPGKELPLNHCLVQSSDSCTGMVVL